MGWEKGFLLQLRSKLNCPKKNRCRAWAAARTRTEIWKCHCLRTIDQGRDRHQDQGRDQGWVQDQGQDQHRAQDRDWHWNLHLESISPVMKFPELEPKKIFSGRPLVEEIWIENSKGALQSKCFLFGTIFGVMASELLAKISVCHVSQPILPNRAISVKFVPVKNFEGLR